MADELDLQRQGAAPTIACDLQALGPERQAHIDQTTQLFGSAQAIRELPDGYAFHFAAADYERVISFIGRERQCCPFYTFRLTLPPGEAPLWLEISGPEGARELIQLLAQSGAWTAGSGQPLPLSRA